MLRSNPSKWEDPTIVGGCFISRTNCFSTFRLPLCFISLLRFFFLDICIFLFEQLIAYLNTFSEIFLSICFYGLHIIISLHKIQDNRLKFTCEPIHSESIADFTALLAQGWTVGYSQRFTAKRVTRSRVDPPLMRLNRSTLRTWTACR